MNNDRLSREVFKRSSLTILLQIVQEFLFVGTYGIVWMNLLGVTNVHLGLWTLLVIIKTAVDIWVDSRVRKNINDQIKKVGRY